MSATPEKVRSVFISDVHLGTSACQAKYLLDMLQRIECEQLFLVGDIVDLLALRKRAQFPALHQAVIARIVAMAQAGVDVVYIPGNHDALIRRFNGQTICSIRVANHSHYKSLDGRTFLVSHGDEFDTLLQCAPWLNWLGDISHEFLLKINTLVNAIRRGIGKPYWSLARSVKNRIGSAQVFIEKYEKLAAHRALEQQVDGFICGHIHHWQMCFHGAALYMNDGDWVEHCSVLFETKQGEFQLWHWADTQELLVGEAGLSKPEQTPSPAYASIASQ